MPRTELSSAQIRDATIARADLNTQTPGAAVVAKIVAGTGIAISQTGADSGTGDVTVSGMNLDYLGDYAPATYNDGDIVVGPDGIAYMCVKDGTTTPPEAWPGTGIVTAEGPPGPQGPQGPQGDPGPTGSVGDTGSAGVPGEQWYSGSGAPAGATGVVGDWYLDTATGDVYEKTGASAWTIRGNIKGPKGDTGTTGSQGIPGITRPFQLGHTWGLVGDVSLLTTLPSIFIPFNATQAAVLVSVRTKLASGTSVGVQIKRNGSNVGSVITVTPTAATTSLGNVALAANDELTLVLSAPVGTPTHLTVTVIVEHTP